MHEYGRNTVYKAHLAEPEAPEITNNHLLSSLDNLIYLLLTTLTTFDDHAPFFDIRLTRRRRGARYCDCVRGASLCR